MTILLSRHAARPQRGIRLITCPAQLPTVTHAVSLTALGGHGAFTTTVFANQTEATRRGTMICWVMLRRVATRACRNAFLSSHSTRLHPHDHKHCTAYTLHKRCFICSTATLSDIYTSILVLRIMYRWYFLDLNRAISAEQWRRRPRECSVSLGL
jgi:hypothetical protein